MELQNLRRNIKREPLRELVNETDVQCEKNGRKEFSYPGDDRGNTSQLDMATSRNNVAKEELLKVLNLLNAKTW